MDDQQQVQQPESDMTNAQLLDEIKRIGQEIDDLREIKTLFITRGATIDEIKKEVKELHNVKSLTYEKVAMMSEDFLSEAQITTMITSAVDQKLTDYPTHTMIKDMFHAYDTRLESWSDSLPHTVESALKPVFDRLDKITSSTNRAIDMAESAKRLAEEVMVSAKQHQEIIYEMKANQNQLLVMNHRWDTILRGGNGAGRGLIGDMKAMSEKTHKIDPIYDMVAKLENRQRADDLDRQHAQAARDQLKTRAKEGAWYVASRALVAAFGSGTAITLLTALGQAFFGG